MNIKTKSEIIDCAFILVGLALFILGYNESATRRLFVSCLFWVYEALIGLINYIF